MKKKIIIVISFIVIAALAAGTYFFFLKEEKKPPRQTRDRSGDITKPTIFPLNGKTFVVPDTDNQVVNLSLVAPSATRNYPMGRFTLVGTTTKEGQLIALDYFNTPLEAGRRAVPITVAYPNEPTQYYLAIITEDGANFSHVASLPLGPNLQINSVTRNGNEVRVDYSAHAFKQPTSEVPSVNTAAVVDIASATFLEEGRKPWLEVVEDVKQFTGKYIWQETVAKDGTKTAPSTAGVFTLTFDANRIKLGTDCNEGSAEFTPPTVSVKDITFSNFAATTRFCESVEEKPYFEMIQKVTSYEETSDVLTFALNDGSKMIFTKPTETLEYGENDPTE